MTNENTYGFGLTKREYFAVMAMQGQLAAESEDTGFGPEYAKNADRSWAKDADNNFIVIKTAESRYAERSIALADALIDALNTGAK